MGADLGSAVPIEDLAQGQVQEAQEQTEVVVVRAGGVIFFPPISMMISMENSMNITMKICLMIYMTDVAATILTVADYLYNNIGKFNFSPGPLFFK